VSVAAEAPELVPPPPGVGRTAWRRVRADPLALAAGLFLVLLFLACFVGGPLAARALGHGPGQYYVRATDFATQKPVGLWTRVPAQPSGYPPPTAHSPRTLFVLGADGPLGRDEFLRLLYGGQSALEIALGATLVAVLIGTFVGLVAGFFGGLVDMVASRTTELVAAFPFLLLVIAMGWTIGLRLNNVRLGFLPKGVLAMVVVIGVFTWPYPARLVRAQVVSLRNREFVEAARMIGASEWRIIRSHLVPHVAPTLIAYGTLILATNIVLEAALSVLNLGIQIDTPDWGNMLSQNFGGLIANTSGAGFDDPQQSIWTQVFPASAILLTVLAFTLLGEALREAVDPHSQGVGS
jgi:peptide/nickel transport system permease protein